MAPTKAPEGPRQFLLRQAQIAQTLTAGWMIVELAVAVGAGIAARSVALTAFGVDSGIEVFTSLVVLRQLIRQSGGSGSNRLVADERHAARLVGCGLYGLIIYIVISSAWSLLSRNRPEASLTGTALAVSSFVIMPVLWRWRLGLSRRLNNPALKADAACSVVCLYMAGTLLAGLLLNCFLGWWWADPLAGLAMIWWIRGEANEALTSGRSGECCHR